MKRRTASPARKTGNSTSPRRESSPSRKLDKGDRDRVKADQLEPLAATSAHHIKTTEDPDDYKPHQLEWWRKVVKKDVKFYLFYVAGFALFTYFCEPCPAGHSGQPGRLIGATTRAALTLIFALLAIVTLYIDIWYGTPAEPGDRKWHLLLDGHSGHFSYLTINILTTWAVYWPYSALSEWLWLTSDSVLVRKTVTATYTFAVFSSTLGTLLTLLFLQFNWYNESWRRETLDMYDKRGNKMFRRKILFTHLNQLPVAFFDVVVLKQNHHILEWATPDLLHVFMVCFLYSLAYLSFTHFNHRTNGGVYPYTFMDTVFMTWKSEILFFLALSLFSFFVTAFYHFIAEEADYVESFLFKQAK